MANDLIGPGWHPRRSSRKPRQEGRASLRRRSPRRSERGLYEFFGDDGGNIWYGNGELVEAVPLPDAERARMLAMVRLRDHARDLMAFERSCSDDDLVSDGIAALEEKVRRFRQRTRVDRRRGEQRGAVGKCGTDYSYQNVPRPDRNPRCLW